MLEPVPAQPRPLRNNDLSLIVLLNKHEKIFSHSVHIPFEIYEGHP